MQGSLGNRGISFLIAVLTLRVALLLQPLKPFTLPSDLGRFQANRTPPETYRTVHVTESTVRIPDIFPVFTGFFRHETLAVVVRFEEMPEKLLQSPVGTRESS